MADSKAHKYVAVTAALGATAYIAKEQKGLDFWLQLLGSTLGALCTGNLPDIFEPAVSSCHWSTFHSISAGAAIGSQTNGILGVREFCYGQAEQCRENPRRILEVPLAEGVSLPLELNGTVGLTLSLIERCLWLLVAGFAVGAATGYVSHLALDAVTCKRPLPLLTKGL